MRSILLTIKANSPLALISSLFLHHNQKFGMMAVLTDGRVRNQTEISTSINADRFPLLSRHELVLASFLNERECARRRTTISPVPLA
jgi:hypothetical protein